MEPTQIVGQLDQMISVLQLVHHQDIIELNYLRASPMIFCIFGAFYCAADGFTKKTERVRQSAHSR